MHGTRQFGGRVDDLIEPLTSPEAGAAFLECQAMNLPVDFVSQGSRGGLLFRPQVFAVYLGGTQAAVRLRLEIIKLAGLGKTDLAREPPPIVQPKDIQHAEDLVVVCQTEMASQVDAPISESPCDGALLGGKLEEEGPAAVGRGGAFFHQRQQIVGDRDARNLSRVEV